MPESFNGENYQIRQYSFYYKNFIESVIIPDSVTSIGDRAFYGCSGLTSITIPDSVTSIGENAFCDCSGLTSIVVESGNTVYDSRNDCNAIIETASNTLIQGCKNTVIPEGVTRIGNSAFNGCSGLTSVVISEGVTRIGNSAFLECSGLVSITIPASVTNIENSAFYRCVRLTTVNYRGTQDQWNTLVQSIGTGNEYLLNANIVYGYTGA